MYRLKIIDNHNNIKETRWYNEARTAHIIAFTIVKNKDADTVEVYNLAERRVEKVYVR